MNCKSDELQVLLVRPAPSKPPPSQLASVLRIPRSFAHQCRRFEVPQASRCSRWPPESSGSAFAACPGARFLHANGADACFLLQIGTLILLRRIGNGGPPWAVPISYANRFLGRSILVPFQMLLGHLAKLLKSAIYIYRVSAERIGLGRESGLADDLLQTRYRTGGARARPLVFPLKADNAHGHRNCEVV